MCLCCGPQEQVLFSIRLHQLVFSESGKSLVYQLPALVTSKLTVVVSPLISLMFDQVQHLTKHGIAADVICSAKTRVQNQKVFHFFLYPQLTSIQRL